MVLAQNVKIYQKEIWLRPSVIQCFIPDFHADIKTFLIKSAGGST